MAQGDRVTYTHDHGPFVKGSTVTVLGAGQIDGMVTCTDMSEIATVFAKHLSPDPTRA